jgi:hypothetical protein
VDSKLPGFITARSNNTPVRRTTDYNGLANKELIVEAFYRNKE